MSFSGCLHDYAVVSWFNKPLFDAKTGFFREESFVKLGRPGGPSQMAFMPLRPHQNYDFELSVSDVYKFDRVGTYEITAMISTYIEGHKEREYFKAVSNPLLVKIVPTDNGKKSKPR